MPPATIDLGEPSRAAEVHTTPWVVGRRLRRWHRTHPRRGRQAATALVIVGLVLATAAADGADPGPTLAPVLSLTAHAAETADDRVYTLTPEPTGTAVVTAYQLPSGAVRWRSRIRADQRDLSFQLQDGLLGRQDGNLQPQGEVLGIWRPGNTRPAAPFGDTALLDSATGRALGTYPGRLIGSRAGLAYLHNPPVPGAPGTVTAVEVASGTVSWRREVHAEVSLVPSGPGYLVVFDDPRGVLTVYPLGPGEPLATTTLEALPADQSVARGWNDVGRTLVFDYLAGARSLTGYDLDTLVERWRIEDAPYGAPIECGGLVCVFGGTPRLRALDPATGEQVWAADWLPPEAGGGGLFAPEPGTDGYLTLMFASDAVADAATVRWLVDPADGGLVAAVGPWRPAPGGGRGATAVRVAQGDDGPELRMGRVRPDGSGVAPLAAVALPSGNHDCTVGAGAVVCLDRQVGGAPPIGVRAWRIRG